MVCSRILCLAFIFCGTFLLLNAFFSEQNDLNEIISIFREINGTPPLVIERLESALAKGKTMYTADELSKLFQEVFEGIGDDEEQTYNEKGELDIADDATDDATDNDTDDDANDDTVDDLIDDNEPSIPFDLSQSEEWEEEELPIKVEEDKFEGENISVKEEL